MAALQRQRALKEVEPWHRFQVRVQYGNCISCPCGWPIEWPASKKCNPVDSLWSFSNFQYHKSRYHWHHLQVIGIGEQCLSVIVHLPERPVPADSDRREISRALCPVEFLRLSFLSCMGKLGDVICQRRAGIIRLLMIPRYTSFPQATIHRWCNRNADTIARGCQDLGGEEQISKTVAFSL